MSARPFISAEREPNMPAAQRRRLAGIIASFVVAAVAIAAASARYDALRDTSPANVTVIYIGADDCAPCRVWQRERRPQFVASTDFQRISFREVRSAKLFELLNDEYWPQDLRHYRNTLDGSAGAPLWFIVANDNITLTARGLSEWNQLALPKIRSLLH